MELKPVGYLVNSNVNGQVSATRLVDNSLTEEQMKHRAQTYDELYVPLYAIPEGYTITEDKAAWEVKKLLALAWEAIQEAGYEDHSFELRDKIDQYIDEAGGVK